MRLGVDCLRDVRSILTSSVTFVATDCLHALFVLVPHRTDMTCICTNADYQSEVGQCVLTTCGQDAVAAATEMQTEMCANGTTSS